MSDAELRAAARLLENVFARQRYGFATATLTCEELAAAQGLARAYLDNGGWRDIADAPRDGTPVFILREGWPAAFVAHWDKVPDAECHGWFLDQNAYVPGAINEGFVGWNEDIESGVMPTHWMPIPESLPPPPATGTTAGEV